MTTVRPPTAFRVEADRNPSESFAQWKDGFEIFSEAAKLHKKPMRQQRAILLTRIGPLGLELYRELEQDIFKVGTIKGETNEQDAKIHWCDDILRTIEK